MREPIGNGAGKLAGGHSTKEGSLSSEVEETLLSMDVSAEMWEALQDFGATFGLSPEMAAKAILSEYLLTAGYNVEKVDYLVPLDWRATHA